MRELPDGVASGFQVRALAGSVAGAPSLEMLGAPAVVGPDGISRLHGSPQRAQGGRTWRLADSPTVIDVPAGLEVWVWVAYGDDRLGISNAATGYTVYVNPETGVELESRAGGFVFEPPCGLDNDPPPHPYRRLAALFDEMRASIRLQPMVP